MLRFCSKSCKKAYEHMLQEERRAKLRHLAFLAPGTQTNYWAGIPSVNFTPRMTFGNWLWPSRRRQLLSAASASLKIMASAVLFERHPLERTVR